jgi:hypothetical protein
MPMKLMPLRLFPQTATHSAQPEAESAANHKRQLYGFLLTAGILAVSVVLAAHSAWDRLNGLQTNLTATHSDSFHLAEHIEPSGPNFREPNSIFRKIDSRRRQDDEEVKVVVDATVNDADIYVSKAVRLVRQAGNRAVCPIALPHLRSILD